MTPEDMKQITQDEIERRVREGMKAVLEAILEEEKTRASVASGAVGGASSGTDGFSSRRAKRAL